MISDPDTSAVYLGYGVDLGTCGSLVDLESNTQRTTLKPGAAGKTSRQKLGCSDSVPYLEKQCGFPHNSLCDPQDRPREP